MKKFHFMKWKSTNQPSSLDVNTCGTNEEFISDIQMFPIDNNFCEDVKFLAARGLFKNHRSLVG